MRAFGRIVVGALTLAALMVGPAAAQAPDCVAIDDFCASTVGQFPAGWKPRKDEGKDVYSLQEEGGARFMRAVSRGLGIQAGRGLEWDLQEFPVVAWSWRAKQFPEGADERKSGSNDSVASVYVLAPHSKVRGPKAVKYIWSERVPVGERLNSNAGLTQVRVLRSGRDGAGEWREERVNVRDDYLQLLQRGRTRRARPASPSSPTPTTPNRAAGQAGRTYAERPSAAAPVGVRSAKGGDGLHVGLARPAAFIAVRSPAPRPGTAPPPGSRGVGASRRADRSAS